jgi:hypothetical protein
MMIGFRPALIALLGIGVPIFRHYSNASPNQATAPILMGALAGARIPS